MSLHPQESARLNHEHHYGAFQASVPSRAGKFPPLPKRQSPKPWDFDEQSERFLVMRKYGGISQEERRADKPVNADWGILAAMEVGHTFLEKKASYDAVKAAVRAQRLKSGARFEVVIDNDGFKQITRVG